MPTTARRLGLLTLPLLAFSLLLLTAALPGQRPLAPSATSVLYTDALGDGWNNWSWDQGSTITVNLAAGAPVHAGTASIAVTYTGGWSGLKLARLGELPASDYDTLRFWVHGGGTGGQQLTVMLEGTGSSGQGVVITPTANAWTQYNLPLANLGAPSGIGSVVWFNSTSGSQPTFYLDEVSLVHTGASTPTSPAPGAGPALSVNAAASQHPISPYIYGMNFADPALAADLDLPVNRWGGNATTRYNWQLDMSNRASDWYFQNIPNDNPNPGALPAGSASDDFVEANTATGTDTILTVPLIGWTPKGPRARACGFSVAVHGPQQATAPDNSDCGNGVHTDGTTLVTGNNPLATSIAITPAFVADWVQHLGTQFGLAGAGGVRFYNLDNEPMLWSHTHRDVHPSPTSYDEMRDRTYAYAAALKAADPQAQLLGPVLWGWTAYFYSALDVADGGAWWNTRSDRRAHGDVPFVEWYLQQMQAYETAHGVRLLDYLDLHFYPQAGQFSEAAGNTTLQQLRLRSTQALWNPAYVDESWINEPVYLIPRMRAWVDTYYPGTKLAMTEYNWGAMGHLNGAVTQADILGLFGREGLDLATLWDPPTFSEPGAFAFRMYRNYDGDGGRFGNQSVQAFSADEQQLAIYAARRTADGALTIMVINKSLTAALTSPVGLSGFSPAASAAVYRYSAANLSAIVPLPNQTVTAGGFTATFPPHSITLFVLSSGTPLTPRVYLPLVE